MTNINIHDIQHISDGSHLEALTAVNGIKHSLVRSSTLYIINPRLCVLGHEVQIPEDYLQCVLSIIKYGN